MKKILFIVFAIIISNVSAQTNFIQGTVTTNDGTVHDGLINYQDWKRTPDYISFKQGDNVKNYSPKDIVAFAVTNDKYISKLVNLEVTEQRLQEMNTTNEIEFEEKHVFLNVLAEGKANLYEFRDYRYHFFAEKEGEFMELISRKSLENNNNDLRTFKKYLGQLNVIFNDCQSVSPKSDLEYKIKPLTKIFQKYNQCVSPDTETSVYTKQDINSKGKFYVTAGYAFSNYKLDYPALYVRDYTGGSFSTPSFGLAYDIFLSKNIERWALRGELMYSVISSEFDPEPNEDILESKFYFKNNSLGLNVLIRYNFKGSKGNKLIPFINAGPGYSLIFSGDNYINYRRTAYPTRESTIDLNSNSGYFTVTAGLGIAYEKFSVEARLMLTDKIIPSSHNSNSITNFGLVASYQLF